MIFRAVILVSLFLCRCQGIAQTNCCGEREVLSGANIGGDEKTPTPPISREHAGPSGEPAPAVLPDAPSRVGDVTEVDGSSSGPFPLAGPYVRELALKPYKRAAVIDGEFLILNALQVAAAVADAETTISCVRSQACHEVNPILGSHPTAGRMYALAVPVTALSVYVTYHYKKKSPSKGWWRVYPISLFVLHSLAAIHNY